MKATRKWVARCALLRERFAAIGGVLECGKAAKALGVYCAGHPEARQTRRQPRDMILPKPSGRGFVSLGAATNGEPSQWVKTADERKAKALGKRNRRKGRAALTEIGEKAGVKKLPKIRKYSWQTGDAGTASPNAR